jgi:RNA polymerase sigma-70 factor (ECF subfamily)
MDFWELYDRHYSRVRAYAKSMLRDAAAADDVVQETFIRAQANVEGLREPAKVLGWLLRITHNLCIDVLRARQAARIDGEADPELAPAARVEASVQSDLERAEMSACVRDKVEQLPETDRWAILLYDIAGLSHAEIASVLDIEVGAVKVRLHRARTKLRTLLEDACAFDHDERNVLVCEPKRPER